MTWDTMMAHSISGNTLTNATRLAHNSIQGHHHSLFGVAHYADSTTPRWSMTVGCLMDPHSPAARYGAGNVIKRPILGCGMILGEGGNTLVISDLHFPYHHRDTFDFLYELDRYFAFEHILSVGDVFDNHRGSYHEDEPDSLNAEEEYEQAKFYGQQLQDLFPVMHISRGNHDDIPVRKLKTIGLPPSMLSCPNKLYDLDDTWVWHDRYKFDSKGGVPVAQLMTLNKRGRWDKKIMKSHILVA